MFCIVITILFFFLLYVICLSIIISNIVVDVDSVYVVDELLRKFYSNLINFINMYKFVLH